MSATQATIGQGATFSIGTTSSPVTYTAVTELKSIEPPNETVGELEATNLSSPNYGKEYIAGLYDGGSITLSGNYLGDTAQTLVETNLQGRITFPWKITGNCQSGAHVVTITGSGFFTEVQIGPFKEGAITEFKAKLKVTGVPTVAVV